ncbi:Phosphoenolpyruvate-dependent phosphotransferase system [Desulfonema limicola]|uniref:Phosphoenolpyruvate-protein phosphotransferase n=1 Tax=Desulfonema limicola TaxID=45656 RepID=A0A975BE56_9BACT|nr:phosphoenolpyruvate--protein phosphotransferase [Desulfonema limicola]QTA83440.1 Phosphoenolpyruvate-dependent phosphotransferase system [Desulfonema limicola]
MPDLNQDVEPDIKPDTENQEIFLKGIGAAPGICIGLAYLVDKEGVNVVKKYYIGAENIDNEKKRFKAAVKKAKDELHKIIQETPDDFRQHASILETHVVLLKDKMLYGKTIETINHEKINAEWALKKVVSELKKMFQSMSDPYFRDRADDIVHVSDRIMRSLVGGEQVNIRDINKRVILVASDLSPAETSQIQLVRIKGFVTERGGISSHTGIIARTLEIPAVLGLHNAGSLIKNDDLIIVDGTTGIVVIRPSEDTIVEYEERSIRYEAYKAEISRGSQLPAQTLDGFSIQIMGNIELPEEVVSVRDYGGNGIGLYRTEFQYMSRAGFPTEDELFDKYKDVVEVMSPNPVTIRTLDINGDKALPYASVSEEMNPALGMRAIRYCLKNPDIFKTQLRAILRAAIYGNVRIMFPMISNCEEVIEAKKLLKEAAASLHEQDIAFKEDIDVGIMVEVPSAVIIADLLADEVDFFSIGTNDLIQYSLAIDRGNRHVSYLYNPVHPAIIRMLKHISDIAHNKGIKLFMCGEMAGNPHYIPILLGLNMDELSMNPQSIPAVKNAIRSLSMKDAGVFFEKLITIKTEQEMKALLEESYGNITSDHVYTP